MDHLAIMKKSWGLLGKILSEEKKVESRWRVRKTPPWDRVKPGDLVYFKDSGEPVTVRAEVERVEQYADLTPEKVKEILDKYGQADGLGIDDIPKFYELFKCKRYCVLVFLRNPEKIEPFEINRKGLPSSAGWITIDDIKKLHKTTLGCSEMRTSESISDITKIMKKERQYRMFEQNHEN